MPNTLPLLLLYLMTSNAISAFWVGDTLEQIIAGSLIAKLKKSY